MKRGIFISAIAFAIALAVIFGVRASTDALAVILGVILGVAASVPTTFLVTYMLIRPNANQFTTPSQPIAAQPPVVVINTSDKPAVSAPPSLPLLGSPNQSRKWTVIGDPDTET
jgi:energy-coupling factor transporter transmembrane protein EcfT